MSYDSFDVDAFVKSLDLSAGLFRLTDVQSTELPTVVIAIAELNISPEQKAQIVGIDGDMSMPMWVMWMPERGILRMHINLDLGVDSIGEERLNILTEAANYINFAAWDRIGKVYVHKSDEDDVNIGSAAFTLLVPQPMLEAEDGLQALRLIVGANMSRLYQESTVTSVDLHQAMAQAGMPRDDVVVSTSRH